jgi:hypothetical protein
VAAQALPQVVAQIATAAAGGGSLDDAMALMAPSLFLSGSAATGLALAGADVAATCATGKGAAKTAANGRYEITIPQGKLPCAVEVSGSRNGVAIKLHSLAESGQTDPVTAVTRATAHVTSVTEMIVAQFAAGRPVEFFETFDAAKAAGVTAAKLGTDSQEVLTALKNATGIDLGGIDPFKGVLSAATEPTANNPDPYDKALDQLGQKVAAQALPQVVAQIATAAAGGGSGSLGDAMASIENGALAGCPVAQSGRYRVLDYFGWTYTVELDFKTMQVTGFWPDPFQEKETSDIAADAKQACAFSFAIASSPYRVNVVMSPAGIGAYHAPGFGWGGGSPIGYLIPVQSHPVSALARGGDWTFLRSGFEVAGAVMMFGHGTGKASVKADGSVTVCDYAGGNYTTCVPDGVARTIQARSDGGFDVSQADAPPSRLYGYRSPNGTLNLFGSQNPDLGNEDRQTSMVLTQAKTLPVRAVGSVANSWDVQLQLSAGPRITTSIVTFSYIATKVEGNAVTRTRASDGRVDTMLYNEPIPGMSHRNANAVVPVAINGLVIQDAGIVLVFNSDPAALHYFDISLTRP